MEQGIDNAGVDIELEGGLEKKRSIRIEDLSTLAVKDFDLSSKSDTQSNDSDDEPPDQSCEFIGNALEKFWTKLGDFFSQRSAAARSIIYIIFAILYNVYFVASVHYSIRNGIPMDWCDGVGFLIVLTGIIYLGLFYFQIVKKFWGKSINRAVMKPAGKAFDRAWKYSWVRYGFYLVLLAGLLTFLIIDTADERVRLQSFGGLLVFLLLSWIFSKYPSRVIWRHVMWGIALQLMFGLIVLRWDFGRRVFECLGQKVTTFLDYTNAGSSFVYGYLVTDQNTSGIALGTIFAFKILSVIFFFSFFVNILYYYGIMQWVVQKLGWLLQVSVGTTAAESMNAAANIFLGQTEAPLLIRPFLPKMTKSEIHAVMVGGFATIAGSVLAAYISFGISASQLLSASVMAAPAALALAKLFYPETEKSQTKAGDIKVPKGTEANALDAAAQGAANAVFLVANIIANLIAFLAFIAFLNGVISWYGNLLGAPYVTFEWIMGKVFIPVAFLMGVAPSECYLVANLVALKTIVNEFAAYSKLSEYIAQGIISKRSETIATFALCGFANPGSIGTQIAALATMAPDRQSDLAQVAFRAFIAGSTASFMNACVAGTLISTVSNVPLSTTYAPSTLTFTPNITAIMGFTS
ncbi:Solute carrier family 28 member 3 [Daphnia magna]|uniref:Sodium/nucleoside cotransporter n=1 Tax=Daphnia magna TaxID=35525 RepID=A0A0P5MVC5_9CRUS|nr:Solute carrier family 28 member 3 [Daphnia magna]